MGKAIRAQVLVRTIGCLLDGTERLNENILNLIPWEFPGVPEEEGTYRFAPMRAYRGPGKTDATAGLGSCLDMGEEDYERYSKGFARQYWTQYVSRWRNGDAIPPRKQTALSYSDHKAEDLDSFIIGMETESTVFEIEEQRISVEVAMRLASIIRERAHERHLIILDAYIKHGNVRSAAEALGIPKSTFHDALRRAKREARRLVRTRLTKE